MMEQDSQDLAKEIQSKIKKSQDHLTDWTADAIEAYDFYAGHQWSEEDKGKLAEQLRPALVFNRIPRVVNTVCGLEIQNRQDVSYIPRNNDDVKKADLLNSAAAWTRQNCDAEDEESQAFKDAVLTGMGWIEIHLDYEEDPDGVIKFDRIDPLEMCYDPDSCKRNLSDAKWIARLKTYSKKEFKSIWPDAEIFSQEYYDHPQGMTPHNETEAAFYRNDQSSNKNKDTDKVQVAQYQYFEREVFYRAQDPQGNISSLEESEYSKYKDFMELSGFKIIKQTRKIFKQKFLLGDQILEEGDSPINGFTLLPITGFIDRNKNTWFGLFSLTKDPQMWSNKWLSQSMHIMNSSAKGGYMAEKTAFEDPRQAEKTIATTNITWLEEGGLNQIKEKTTPQFPAALNNLFTYATGSISELVGVNLELLGAQDNNQSGVLEYQRRKSGMTVIADFFDALRRYRKEAGRVLADFIIEYISDGRMVKISDNERAALIKDELEFSYDITVDETVSSPDQRELVFSKIMALLPQLLQANVPIPPELIEYTPLPGKLIEKWKELIEQNEKSQSEAAKISSEIEQEKEALRKRIAELEAQKVEAEVREKVSRASETESKVPLNVAKTQEVLAKTNESYTDALAKTEEVKRKNLSEVNDMLSQ